MPSDRSTKRHASNERLRGSFLGQLGSQVRELAALFELDGTEALDTVQAELHRVARTAGALGLETIAEAASVGADATTTTGELTPVLGPLAKVIRHVEPARHFAPIGIVGDAELLAAIERNRATITEGLVLGATLDAVCNPLAVVPFAALLVPVDQVADARERAEGAPVIAWGEGRDWQARLDAVEAGADGFVPRRLALGALLERVRTHVSRSTIPPEVFVLAEPDDRREAWIDALFDAGYVAVASAMPAEIAPALDVVCPDLVLLGHEIDGVAAASLVRAIRTHSDRAYVPTVVVGDGLDEDLLRDAGADDLLPADIPPEQLVSRVRQRLDRALTLMRGRHAVSGARDRASTLAELDNRLGHTLRVNQPLSVCLFQLDGLEDARVRFGKAAVNAAQRIANSTLRDGLRRLDIVGHIADDVFLVALHDCPERVARQRLSNLARKIETVLHADHRLRGVLCLYGIADTELGVERVAQRADEDLLAVRG